jgi:hypothetical protein
MLGALAGLVHGGVCAVLSKIPLSKLQIPAGPGFAVGIALSAGWQFRDFFLNAWSLLT